MCLCLLSCTLVCWEKETMAAHLFFFLVWIESVSWFVFFSFFLSSILLLQYITNFISSNNSWFLFFFSSLYYCILIALLFMCVCVCLYADCCWSRSDFYIGFSYKFTAYFFVILRCCTTTLSLFRLLLITHIVRTLFLHLSVTYTQISDCCVCMFFLVF